MEKKKKAYLPRLHLQRAAAVGPRPSAARRHRPSAARRHRPSGFPPPATLDAGAAPSPNSSLSSSFAVTALHQPADSVQMGRRRWSSSERVGGRRAARGRWRIWARRRGFRRLVRQLAPMAAVSCSSRERERHGVRERGKRGRNEKEKGRGVREAVTGGGAALTRHLSSRTSLLLLL